MKRVGEREREREWPNKGGDARERECWHCCRELIRRKWDGGVGVGGWWCCFQ